MRKYQKRFFTRQHLPHLDGKPCQQHQQHGQDAEHLTEGKAVAGAVAQAEGKLQKQGDEVGVVLGKGAEDELEARRRALQKGSFGPVLFVDIVDVIPDIHKAAAAKCPEKVDQRRRPQADEHRFVEEVKFDSRHPQHQQHTGKQGKVAPQAHQRKKEFAAGAASAKTASSTAAAASTSTIFAAAETRGFVMGSDME